MRYWQWSMLQESFSITSKHILWSCHSASTQVSTQKCGLYWKDCQVWHNPRGFWYKVHASYFYKGISARRSGGRICWMSWGDRGGKSETGWKINWHVLYPMSWELYVDGAANQRGSGVGLVLVSPEKITIEKSLWLSFLATNNEVEYEVLLMGMAMV